MSLGSLTEYARLLNVPYKGPDLDFYSVGTDTRTLKQGDLFVAIRGQHLDGHRFLKEAQQTKAVGAIVETKPNQDFDSFPCLEVSDTRRALKKIAQYHRSKFSLPLIALTGSCGKTTTKEYLRTILSQEGQVLAPEKSFNNEIGVPLTLLKLNPSFQFGVLELGANAQREISQLTQIVRPKVAMILNVGPAHLEGFGSIEDIAQAKAEIFEGLSEEGTAIINEDDIFSSTWKKQLKGQTVLSFGKGSNADFSAQKIILDQKGNAKFQLCSAYGNILIRLPLVGEHQVDNALAAASAALSVGISLESVKKGLENTVSLSGRLSVFESSQGATILDDTYNANPSSVWAALKVLKHYSGERIVVLGDMYELGDQTHVYHKKIGQWAKDLNIEKFYTCGELARFSAIGFGKHAKHFDTQRALIQTLLRDTKKNSIILVKGSRGARMEKVLEIFK